MALAPFRSAMGRVLSVCRHMIDCVPAEPGLVVAGGQQSLEGAFQRRLALEGWDVGPGELPVLRREGEGVQVGFRQCEPENSGLADFLRRGVPLRLVAQAPAVGGYAVAGSLPGPGLGQRRCAPELLPSDGDDVHHRYIVLPIQKIPEGLLRCCCCGFIRCHGHEVHVGVVAVVAYGAGPQKYDLCRLQPFLHFPGYGQAFGVGSVAARAQACSIAGPSWVWLAGSSVIVHNLHRQFGT